MSRGNRIVAVVVLVATLSALAACSTTDEISFDPTGPPASSTTTIDPLDADPLSTGAAGISELQGILDKLVALPDTCSILAQKEIQENRLDPTLFTTAAARQVLAEGLVKVFDHLITISDPSLTSAFEAEKTAFSSVLDVVDRYSSNPSNTKATDEINTLVSAPGFLTAQTQIASWLAANCS